MRIELYKLDLHNLVEFSVTLSEENYRICSSDSYFMDEQLFYLFQSCFEKSSKLFDYYEPTKYDLRNIVPLLNELKKIKSKLEKSDSVDSFMEFISSRNMGAQFLKVLDKDDPDWKNHWEAIYKNLTDVCLKLLSLADQCFNEDKILWVKGY